MSKYYNEVTDDAQQHLIRAMEKLEKSRIFLEERGWQRPADKAAAMIGSIKALANEIDTLPALEDDES